MVEGGAIASVVQQIRQVETSSWQALRAAWKQGPKVIGKGAAAAGSAAASAPAANSAVLPFAAGIGVAAGAGAAARRSARRAARRAARGTLPAPAGVGGIGGATAAIGETLVQLFVPTQQAVGVAALVTALRVFGLHHPQQVIAEKPLEAATVVTVRTEGGEVCLLPEPLRFGDCEEAQQWQLGRRSDSRLLLSWGSTRLYPAVARADRSTTVLCADRFCIRCVARGKVEAARLQLCLAGAEPLLLDSSLNVSITQQRLRLLLPSGARRPPGLLPTAIASDDAFGSVRSVGYSHLDAGSAEWVAARGAMQWLSAFLLVGLPLQALAVFLVWSAFRRARPVDVNPPPLKPVRTE